MVDFSMQARAWAERENAERALDGIKGAIGYLQAGRAAAILQFAGFHDVGRMRRAFDELIALLEGVSEGLRFGHPFYLNGHLFGPRVDSASEAVKESNDRCRQAFALLQGDNPTAALEKVARKVEDYHNSLLKSIQAQG